MIETPTSLPHLTDPQLLAQLREGIGLVAACLTTLSFVPQALHTLRTRDVSGISLGMYSAFTLGVALWLVYGLILGAWPVIIANVLTLALAGSILVMRLRFHPVATAPSAEPPRD
ncbi:MAG TPA: SemiSWEET transporter [Burkholderiaceae bacterium]|nr:SemiSWEET transporter [Burkholderiaceae bacterium]HNG82342.1 SemiSWEET transporter [Burkholderiaceae bacterium]